MCAAHTHDRCWALELRGITRVAFGARPRGPRWHGYDYDDHLYDDHFTTTVSGPKVMAAGDFDSDLDRHGPGISSSLNNFLD